MRLRWVAFLFSCWAGAVFAKEIVPAYVSMASLGGLDVTVEFNTNVHLRPDSRTWYFQNGRRVSNSSKLNAGDSYCYLGTQRDIYEPKTFKESDSFPKMKLVTEMRNGIELKNEEFARVFSPAARDDLYVVGCASKPELKSNLRVGDIYRHFAYNVLLKSDKAAKDFKLVEVASRARPVTAEQSSITPPVRRMVFNRAHVFHARPWDGFDRSRYFFQQGREIEDTVNFGGMDLKRVHCFIRFNDDLKSDLAYPAGAEFVPARMLKSHHGFILESDHYLANPSAIRSVRCERQGNVPITGNDIVEAFGPELISIHLQN